MQKSAETAARKTESAKVLIRLFKHEIAVICGHFGTGKTNIAVNLALRAAGQGKPVYLADLDIVNPYFRTADNAALLRRQGVTALIPEFANTNVDIPSLPPAMPKIFEKGVLAVVDVGGDAEGAAALGVYRENFSKTPYDMYYVFNLYRPDNADAGAALCSLKSIEASSGLRFTGIINNSNLGKETVKDTVSASAKQAKKFAEIAGIPLVMTTAFRHSAPEGAVTIEDMTKKLF